jgi:uncharacterized protein
VSRGSAPPPLEGSRVLLTGASSGIGRALARLLAGRGARLAVAARRGELLDGLADEIEATGGPRPAAIVADLSQRGAAADVAQRAQLELEGVDVLVNNAGGGVGGTQWRVGDGHEGRELLELNLWSPIALTTALVPTMRQRGHGAVVNVTSMSQVMPLWAMGHYSASKAALAAVTDALRLELTGSGVHVLEAVVGPTDTAIQAETRLIPGVDSVLGRAPLADPERLAAAIVRALERGRRRVIYPRSLWPAYALPGLTRRYLERLAGRMSEEMDPDDPRVVRSGSGGDDIARKAREEWARRSPETAERVGA